MTPRHPRHVHHNRRQPQFPDGLDLGDTIQNGLDSLGNAISNGLGVDNNKPVVSVVIKTLPQTFSGPAVFKTLTPTDDSTASAAATTTTLPIDGGGSIVLGAAATAAPSQQPPITVFPVQTTNALTTTAKQAEHTRSLLDTVRASATAPAAQTNAAAPTSAPQSSNSPNISSDQQTTGLSGGARAGIAIGVILAILALAVLAALGYRWKKKQETEAYAKPEDEKNPFGDNAAAATPPASSRQRIAHPSSGPNSHAAGAGLAGAAARTNASHIAGGAVVQDLGKTNPFGNHAAIAPNNPEVPAPLRINTPGIENATLTAGVIASVPAASIADLAQRKNAPDAPNVNSVSTPNGPFMGTAAASPTTSQFSMTSASSGAVAGASDPMNVHRIQLDFKPSMDDELELKAGQLVRLLHEYDDGWALCIRLDRSQQGVAPRTCLSTRPVKPRNNPSAGGPAPGLRMPIQRPDSPAGRSSSPALAPPHDHRSTTSGPNRGPPRSMSPGPYGGEQQPGPSDASSTSRQRSNSATAITDKEAGFTGPPPRNPETLTVVQDAQAVEKIPIKIQAIATPGTSPPRSPVVRKPLPGLAS